MEEVASRFESRQAAFQYFKGPDSSTQISKYVSFERFDLVVRSEFGFANEERILALFSRFDRA